MLYQKPSQTDLQRTFYIGMIAAAFTTVAAITFMPPEMLSGSGKAPSRASEQTTNPSLIRQ